MNKVPEESYRNISESHGELFTNIGESHEESFTNFSELHEELLAKESELNHCNKLLITKEIVDTQSAASLSLHLATASVLLY